MARISQLLLVPLLIASTTRAQSEADVHGKILLKFLA
jgi:hypothetical protein